MEELSPHLLSDGNIKAINIQDQPQNVQVESSMSSIYLQFNISGLYSWLKDWKNQIQQYGTNPSTMSMTFGAEGGFVINRYVQIGCGYEFFFAPKVSTDQIAGDQVNSTFFYGSVRAEMPLESVSNLSLFADFDIGSVTATEVLEEYNLNRTGSTTGYRVMLGAQYFLVDNWSIMADVGYLFGKVNNVSGGEQTPQGYSLDVSGFTMRFAVNYHIPL